MDTSNQGKAGDVASPQQRWWWVNQGQTYKQERQGGYIWAPQKGKNGLPFYHHVNVSQVHKGDVIWHYVDGKIVSISVALEDARESPKPAELVTDAWQVDGYAVKVRYFDLMQPVLLASIPLELRVALSKEGKSPFRSDGAVNQGYLFGISKEFATTLTMMHPVLKPAGKNESADLISIAPLQEVVESDAITLFIKAINNLNVDRDKSGDPRLYKPALLLACIELFERGELTENKILFDSIVPTFTKTLESNGKSGGEKQAAAAFFHMRSEPFWKLILKNTELPQAGEPAQLRRFAQHASFVEPYSSVLMNEESRQKIKNAIEDRWFSKSEDIVEEITDFDFARETANLIDVIAGTGFRFEPWQIACYVTAMKTKPFLILAGVSGSGKSQLPQLVARATGTVSHLVPVRPDWTDSSEILGYVQLQGKLSVGNLLAIAAEANRNSRHHYICIIDEMNLARVEHYFAEILSRIEQGRSGDLEKEPLLTASLADADAHWGQVTLSSNIGLVGTVNMDDSTHGFSKKVLDRAFTLEFSEIDLRDWESHVDLNLNLTKRWPAAAWLPRATRLAELKDISDSDRSQINKVVDVLMEVNEVLGQAQLQLAYRSRDEIAMFVLHASELANLFVSLDGAKVDPLDLALQMKVLPRIAGGSSAVRRVVLELLGWSKDPTKPKFEEDEEAREIITAWTKERKPHFMSEAAYPRTCARLCLMWDRIKNEGYTSFWL